MMIGGNKMLCDDCKKNSACVHLTQIMNGEKVDKQLCEHCAQKYGELVFTNSNNFSVNDFLHSLFSNNSPASQQQQSRVCENCGMSYNDFTAGGKLGCSECYKCFDKKLVPLLRRIHGSAEHSGKVPKRSGGKIELRKKIKEIRKELEAHILAEEYEMAAKLRDEIRTIEAQIARNN